MFTNDADLDLLEEILIEVQAVEQKQLVLFNDDVNTFDHVIKTLIKVCKHDSIQAEQCAMIVHYNGKCTVKTGEFTKIEPMYNSLLEAGLSAQIH